MNTQTSYCARANCPGTACACGCQAASATTSPARQCGCGKHCKCG